MGWRERGEETRKKNREKNEYISLLLSSDYPCTEIPRMIRAADCQINDRVTCNRAIQVTPQVWNSCSHVCDASKSHVIFPSLNSSDCPSPRVTNVLIHMHRYISMHRFPTNKWLQLTILFLTTWLFYLFLFAFHLQTAFLFSSHFNQLENWTVRKSGMSSLRLLFFRIKIFA